MKLGFLVHRTNYYKLYGPLIEAALRRGWSVECVLFPQTGGKAYLSPTPENAPVFDSGKVSFSLNTSDQETLNGGFDAVLSVHPKSKYRFSDAQTFFVSLQHGIDTFIEATPDSLSENDLLCLYSPFWAQWGARYYEQVGLMSFLESLKRIEKNAFFGGFPQMDQMRLIDPIEIRGRYKIKPDQSVVVLLPITLGNKNGVWPRFFETTNKLDQFKALLKGVRTNWRFLFSYGSWFVKGINDARLMEAIREFCNRNNAVLIAKGRLKDKLRKTITKSADIAVYDETHYPATPLELLSIADLCIHFYSFAAVEAAFAETFSLTIDRPSPQAEFGKPAPAYHQLWRGKDEDSAFNTTGVNRLMTIPDAVRSLPRLALNEFKLNAKTRVDYVNKYLGFDDFNSSDRILDRIGELV